MEFDKDKSFGYPVLRPIFDGDDPTLMDYVKANFQPSIHAQIDAKKPEELAVSYEIDFSVPEIKELISTGKAQLFIDIHCKKTFWSKLFPVGYNGDLKISTENLRDEISIHTFCLSTMPVVLNSEKLNPDYAGLHIEVGANKVLAWCQPTVYSVEKEQFRSVRAIIDYKPSPDIEYGEFTLDTEGDYVSLGLNDKFYIACKNAEQDPKRLPMLMNSLFVPVFTELFRQIVNDPDGLGDKRWASILVQRCESKGISLVEGVYLPKVVELVMERPLSKLAKHLWE